MNLVFTVQSNILTTEIVNTSQVACAETVNQPQAVAQSCSVKKVFLKILQNSQENTCARVSFLIKLQTLKTDLDFEILVTATGIEPTTTHFGSDSTIRKRTFNWPNSFISQLLLIKIPLTFRQLQSVEYFQLRM